MAKRTPKKPIKKEKSQKLSKAMEGNQSAVGNNGGTPTKYKKEYADQAHKLCLLGFTDQDLADFFEVSESTINRWKAEKAEFWESVQKGKNIADAEVAKAFYQRAIGYSHPEDKIFQFKGAELIVPTTKHYPPDSGAALNWLSNRQPEKWRQKHTHEHTGKDGGPIKVEDFDATKLTDEELFMMLELRKKAKPDDQ